jgi:hypothetical protein
VDFMVNKMTARRHLMERSMLNDVLQHSLRLPAIFMGEYPIYVRIRNSCNSHAYLGREPRDFMLIAGANNHLACRTQQPEIEPAHKSSSTVSLRKDIIAAFSASSLALGSVTGLSVISLNPTLSISRTRLLFEIIIAGFPKASVATHA